MKDEVKISVKISDDNVPRFFNPNLIFYLLFALIIITYLDLHTQETKTDTFIISEFSCTRFALSRSLFLFHSFSFSFSFSFSLSLFLFLFLFLFHSLSLLILFLSLSHTLSLFVSKLQSTKPQT